MTQVIHAVVRGTVAFLARNLETEETAIIITEPVHKDWRDGGPDVHIYSRGSKRPS